MKLEELKCRKCNAQLTADQLVPGTSFFACTSCKTVYAMEQDGQEKKPAHSNKPMEFPLPERFKIDKTNGFSLEWKWFSWMYIGLLFFAVFWNGFMIVWHTIAFSTKTYFMSAFGLLHTAVGIGIAYWVLAGLLNRTTITVQMNLLTVVHKPLPWFGMVSVSATMLKQLYCVQNISSGRNGHTYRYEVQAVLNDGKNIRLVRNLDQPQQAWFIEQELEKYLGIKNEPMPGEYKG